LLSKKSPEERRTIQPTKHPDWKVVGAGADNAKRFGAT